MVVGRPIVNFFRAAACFAACAALVPAQDVISAKAGLIHYFEGVVTLDGSEVVKKNAEFSSMKEGGELRTGMGRAEVLLTPGVFLRVAENSAVKLVGNDLLNTRLALLDGSVLLEVGEMEKGQALTMTVGEAKLDFSHRGLFRVFASPSELKVYDGSAVALLNGQSVTIKEGKESQLAGVIAPAKFNKEEGDAFYRWASRRSGYIAAANLSAAKRAYDHGSSFAYSNWVYNLYFGMFTFVPMNGFYRSPFGYSYYSPVAVSGIYYRPIYNPQPVNNGGWNNSQPIDRGRGMSDMGGRGGFSGAPAMSAPSISAGSSAPAAGGPRGAGGGGAGGGAGGGRSAGGGR